MSSHGSIITEIMDLIELKRTLADLQLEYEATKKMTTCDGTVHKIDVIIKDPNGRQIGLEKTEKGAYRFISDTAGLNNQQLKVQKDFLNKIRQKYAYNKIVTELKNQGYSITEEEKVQNNTIKLVARKWS
ncbi:MAG: DUF1257 domain-containing protein [Candidatus Omnitrophica bacterium]|nr:DUF1257 domain-containing protein [Candidatus Omnitrophota bacterium]